MTPGQGRKRFATWFVLSVILFSAWALRWRGIEWPLLHPDEYKISSWAYWMEEHTRTLNPSYPGGYFHLVQPLLKIKNACLDGSDSWQDLMGHSDRRDRPEVVETFLLRKINVAFALLTVMLVYALARRITRSRAGALAAAAFVALSRLHAEHSHYAETDIAMLLTLVLALYLWARVCEGRRLRWFLAASLVSGLAIGTKYINLVLIGNLIAGAAMVYPPAATRRYQFRRAILILSGICLPVAGWLYTNRHALDGTVYWKNLIAALHSTYGERTGLLGPSSGDPYAVLRSNWNTLVEGLAEINWIWLGLIAAGMGVALFRRYRRFWAVTLLPLALYLVYFLKLAPWVRSQEFMWFLPCMAILLAMAFREIWLLAGQGRYPRFARAVVVALVVVASVESGISAGRFVSLFGWPDPRIQAMKWLYQHAPLDSRVAVEEYTVPPCRLFGNVVDVGQIERLSSSNTVGIGVEYLLRNESSRGRGTVDPRTHELYPQYAANLADFRNGAQLLVEWGPAAPRYAFVGNRMEWWQSGRASPELSLSSPLFRPVTLDDTRSVSVPVSVGGLGTAAGMFVDSTPRSFVLSGAGPDCRSVYVILQTEERGGTVVVKGMGDRKVVDVPPYSVRVVPLARPWYWPRLSEYEVVTVRAKARPHFKYLPCYAQVAMDPGEVAAILYQKGYYDRALSRLAALPPDSEKEQWLRYVCAVEQRDWTLAARHEPGARKALEGFEAARALKADQLRVNGIGGNAFRDHARLRMPVLDAGREGIQMIDPRIRLLLVKSDQDREFSGTVTLPLRLAPGRYSLHGTILEPALAVMPHAWRMTVTPGCTGVRTPLVLPSDRPGEFSLAITVERESSLALTFSSEQGGGEIELADMELRWATDDILRVQRRDTYRALVLDAFHRGDAASAKGWLEKARVSVPDEACWSRMETEGLSKGTLQGKDNRKVFYPWLELMGADLANSGCQLRFALLKDQPPPLKISVRSRAFRGSKHVRDVTLDLKGKSRGEVVTATFPVPAGLALDDLCISIQADVEFVNTPLRVRGTEDDRVWLGK